MTLSTRLDGELNRLAGLFPATGVPLSMTVDIPPGVLECSFAAIDQLACAFERLTFRTSRLDQASLEDLNKVAESLSKRLSYLLESISPVETDREGCVVQMRSNPPQRGDDGTTYYELVVRRGEISLCRYSKANGQARRMVPAQVTREVFFRLAGDLSSVD